MEYMNMTKRIPMVSTAVSRRAARAKSWRMWMSVDGQVGRNGAHADSSVDRVEDRTTTFSDESNYAAPAIFSNADIAAEEAAEGTLSQNIAELEALIEAEGAEEDSE